MAERRSGRLSNISPRHRRPADSVWSAGWCCLPIWSAISSTTRSAISRWRRWPPASIITPCSGNFSRSRWCFMPRPWSIPASGSGALYQRRQFRWKAIEPLQLVLGLSIPGAGHHPHCRRAARPRAVRDTKRSIRRSFSPTGSCGRYKMWLMYAVDDGGLDPRLHRPLFLAADESVLPARGAVSARRRGADSDAGDARALSGRTQRRSTATAWNGGRRIFRWTRSARQINRPC